MPICHATRHVVETLVGLAEDPKGIAKARYSKN
jgi:hypothetical protein